MISMIIAESELWHKDFFKREKCVVERKKEKEVGENLLPIFRKYTNV